MSHDIGLFQSTFFILKKKFNNMTVSYDVQES